MEGRIRCQKVQFEILKRLFLAAPVCVQAERLQIGAGKICDIQGSAVKDRPVGTFEISGSLQALIGVAGRQPALGERSVDLDVSASDPLRLQIQSPRE